MSSCIPYHYGIQTGANGAGLALLPQKSQTEFERWADRGPIANRSMVVVASRYFYCPWGEDQGDSSQNSRHLGSFLAYHY